MARVILLAGALFFMGCPRVCDVKPLDSVPALNDDDPIGQAQLARLRSFNDGNPVPSHLVRTYCQPKWTMVLNQYCGVHVNKLCEDKCADPDTTEQCSDGEREAYQHSCAERSLAKFKQTLTKCATATGIDSRNGLLFAN